MLYLNETTNTQRPVLPVDGRPLRTAAIDLMLTSTVNRTSHTISCRLYGFSRRYTVLELSLPALQAGEYAYTLAADNEPVASGVAQIGDLNTDVTSYDKSAVYEQYQD